MLVVLLVLEFVFHSESAGNPSYDGPCHTSNSKRYWINCAHTPNPVPYEIGTYPSPSCTGKPGLFPSTSNPVRLAFLSDVHTQYRFFDKALTQIVKNAKNSSNAILLVSGDSISMYPTDTKLSNRTNQIYNFAEWLAGLKQFRYKIVVSGNHDRKEPALSNRELKKIFEGAGKGIYFLTGETLVFKQFGGLAVMGLSWKEKTYIAKPMSGKNNPYNIKNCGSYKFPQYRDSLTNKMTDWRSGSPIHVILSHNCPYGKPGRSAGLCTDSEHSDPEYRCFIDKFLVNQKMPGFLWLYGHDHTGEMSQTQINSCGTNTKAMYVNGSRRVSYIDYYY